MPGFFDWVSNGISTAVQPFTNWLGETRPTDTSRPRVQSSDPTQAIDSQGSLNLLSFPHDRPKYYMSFGFQQYQRPNQFSGLQGGSVQDYICLPMPNNMKDNNTINYSEQPGHILGESMSLMHENGKDALKTGSIGDITKQVMQNVGDAVSGGGQGVTGWGVNKVVSGLKKMESAVGEQGATDSVLQVMGLADNPFMTVMLKGPLFKRHHFIWRLVPKSPDESDTIKNIVGTLKKMAYPGILELQFGGFFQYPYIVWPKFNPTQAADYTYTFKPCLITNLNINNTPNDRPGFYTTGAPNEVILEIGLIEIELWRSGYDTDSNNLPTVPSDFSNFQTPPNTQS